MNMNTHANTGAWFDAAVVVASSPDRRLGLPDGRLLGFSEYGDPGGTPVLYFHGEASSRKDIAFASEAAKRTGVRILAPDRPGLGLSDYQKRRSIHDWPADVETMADSLGLESFSLLGWSAASPYVLACADRLGTRITRAATVGGMSPIDGPGALQEIDCRPERLLFHLCRKAPDAACLILSATRFVPPALFQYRLARSLNRVDRQVIESMTPRQASDFYYEALRSGPRGTVRDCQLIAGPWLVPYSRIQTEFVLWRGEYDLVPRSHTNWLAGRLPSCEVIEVKDQGHLLLHGRTDEVLERLVD